MDAKTKTNVRNCIVFGKKLLKFLQGVHIQGIQEVSFLPLSPKESFIHPQRLGMNVCIFTQIPFFLCFVGHQSFFVGQPCGFLTGMLRQLHAMGLHASAGNPTPAVKRLEHRV